MTLRIAGAVIAAIVLAGCTSVRSVEVNEDPASFRDVNRGVRGEVTRVMLRDGSQLDVVGVHVGPDSLTWVDRASNNLMSISTRDVRQVSIMRAGAGALKGLVVGVVAGAAVGGIRAAVEGDDARLASDPLAVTEKEKYRIYPPAHAVYGALAMTPLGAILGTRRVYRFHASPGAQEVVVDF